MTNTTETTTCEIDVHAIGWACQACAVLAAYDDDTAHEPEAAEEARATIAAIARDERGAVIAGPAPDYINAPALFRCCLCSEDTYQADPALVSVVRA